MSFIKKTLIGVAAVIMLLISAVVFWANQSIIPESAEPVAFAVRSGSGVKSSARQITAAGVPLNETLFSLLVRVSGNSGDIKAGHYELEPEATPMRLMNKLTRGEFVQEGLTIIEGWTFSQMREALKAHSGLERDAAKLSDQALLKVLGATYVFPEGLFFPDTYHFAKGANELQIYRQAYAQMIKRLNQHWEKRDSELPYKSAYEALIMASIIEKETGKSSERDMIAGVFINRLKKGMLLQTDPTVIYGMGKAYKGNIRKRDLLKDTPYNTYTRRGLPPTPIALPGAQSLLAAFYPAKTKAIYFVARGDGSSQFSDTLVDHNRAVDQYQRRRRQK